MEFHENRARAPWMGFTLLGRAIARWWRVGRTRRALSRLSDEQLKDIGISRHDVC
ncbi:MAG: DUF1127 domain-containing protein [Yokenella regensburgei]|jgi:uncharacterized protein YjiS (DUF1127 family)|uniref:Uncharacterized protein YjiS (DUF1127 family) n=1 Tax=Yokenella regensburgei TaxID=158877 RepID=A0ABX9RVW3_9ENTR|nr:DUF1127 domain-containing protein [Yokenella regensburgei]EHM51625.1 hypothetical protein HMPREF0880_00432 [Yokenella regensburgei ATCC 43003]KAF1370761.1 uncharacterized protein YjiS (DUF1127 family) [Yokenella regensburgei]MDQ4429459.1 DUF1127 domain-containing protein [Yokenella regensburgei]MDR3105317.1 DUF1127 domain-containing protein [Yokenella regensburgei]QIU91566.1 DUF1127 domain-containing protein [Yokenella regensburgei]